MFALPFFDKFSGYGPEFRCDFIIRRRGREMFICTRVEKRVAVRGVVKYICAFVCVCARVCVFVGSD